MSSKKKQTAPLAGQRNIASFFSKAPAAPKPTAENEEPKSDGKNEGQAIADKSTGKGEKVVVASPADRRRLSQVFSKSGDSAAEPVKEPAGGPAADKGAEESSPKPAPEEAPAPMETDTPDEDVGKTRKPLPEGCLGAGDVGRRIKVYWKSEKAFFEGNVTDFNEKLQQHHIDYDDGDEEWVTLRKQRFEWIARAPRAAANRNRKVIEDSDDEDAAPAPATQPAAAAAAKGGSAKAKKKSDDSESEYEAEEAESSGSDEDDEAEESEDEDLSEEEEEEQPKKRSKGAKGAAAQKKPAAAAAKKPAASKAPASAAAAAAAPAKEPKEPRAAGPAPTKAQLAKLATAPLATAAAAAAADGGAAKGGLAQISDIAKYQDRNNDRFPFTRPDRIRDAKGRRPDHPDYDPSTLQLPDGFPKFRTAKGETVTLTAAQEQWWRVKAAHWDCVLMFKVGKFYELFELHDATVGAQVLGLMFMKGEQPHCGFPEKNYEAYAERLARAGHRVVVVEQVETPEQLEARNRAEKTKDKVVRREKVAVLTKGTLTDPEMLASSPDAAYVMTVAEAPLEAAAAEAEGQAEAEVVVGVCVADCSTARMLVGQFRDDAQRTRLRSVLAELRPVEAVAPRGGLSDATRRALADGARPPQLRQLPRDSPCWDAQHTLDAVTSGKYFEKRPGAPAAAAAAAAGSRGGPYATWPAALQALAQDTTASAAALSAFGGCLQHVKDSLLDHDLLPLGRIEALPDLDANDAAAAAAGWASGGFVSLDAAALEGLEVLENSEGGAAGSLLAAVDRCASNGGRRLLRQWLCRPLRSPAEIQLRQGAVADLKGPASEAVGAARKALAGAPDVERAIARLAASAAGRGRDAAHVVLYEDAARKRLGQLLAALKGAQAVRAAARAFEPVLAELRSPLLRALVTEGSEAQGGLPNISEALDALSNAFDWAAAEKSGRIEPRPGGDDDVDEAVAAIAAADGDLQQWLRDARKSLGAGSEVCLVANNKDTHQVEVPDRLAAKVPRDWTKASSRKGFQRYTCDDLEDLKKARAAAAEQKEAALAGVLSGLVGRVLAHAEAFTGAAAAAAALDALSSFAMVSLEMEAAGPVCTPKVAALPAEARGGAALRLRALRHPAAASLAPSAARGGGGGGAEAGGFVPNDTVLGRAAPPVLLLTGPNMGGKSTLLRQVCLATLLAQVGADVPAEEMELTPVDAVFVRMGAKDNLAAGQSTFMVELAETAAMLRRATANSLVACDELGRGTATNDGAAIAHAVLQHLATGPRARTLFSTHYHLLADEAAAWPAVALGHMGCHVAPSANGGPETVTFLYRLTEGACPKSYGVNVARIAGLPESVVAAAAARARAMEDADVEMEDAAAAMAEGGQEGPLSAAEAAALRRAVGALEAAAAAAGEDGVGDGEWAALCEAWEQAGQAVAAGA